MSAPADDGRLRLVEISLASHLQGCEIKSQMVWDELKHQRRMLHGIFIGILTTLAGVCGVLIKVVMHL
jgi:hypothetical protein